jgi:sialate O-acetylesterase
MSVRLRIVAQAVLLCVAVTMASRTTRADVKLPSVFSTHMVLQRDSNVPIWGWAEPGATVNVSIAGQTKQAQAASDGRWQVRLDPMSAGGPFDLVVRERNTVTVRDVLVGEVWFASGQSNMVHLVCYVRNAAHEIATANDPQIRIFTAVGEPSQTPERDCRGNWLAISPQTADDVSAVCYFFARELRRTLGVPIGVINASLGSTPIEAWTSREAQADRPELRELLDSWERKTREYDPIAAEAEYARLKAAWQAESKAALASGKDPPREPKPPIAPRNQRQHPAGMYHGLVAPLVPYGVRGFLWYQGEYNAQTEAYASLYRVQLPLLIRDWRTRWGDDDLPFGWVQLPNFDVTTREPVMTGWPTVRDGMLRALSVPNTGMAVTIDVGDADSVHPANKQAIAHRLALWARAEVYGEKIAWSGPIYGGFSIAGNEVALRFRHADGLAARDGALRDFEIRGVDAVWHPAEARIVGNKVFVRAAPVSHPTAVRYAWAANPAGNLVNGAGLPASPFRTDGL